MSFKKSMLSFSITILLLKCRVFPGINQHVQSRDVGDNHLEFHPGLFPGNKIEGVPWYISYYSPLRIFLASPVRLFIFPSGI
jgi:hypothetical protein